MGIGDLVGGLMGGDNPLEDIMAKISESGLDVSSLADLDADTIKGMIEEKGIDLSMLEGLGISVEDLLAKLKG